MRVSLHMRLESEFLANSVHHTVASAARAQLNKFTSDRESLLRQPGDAGNPPFLHAGHYGLQRSNPNLHTKILKFRLPAYRHWH